VTCTSSELLRLAREGGDIVGSEAEKEMRYVQACVHGLVPVMGARWDAPDPKERHVFFGNPGQAKEQLKELIFGHSTNRTLAGDFEAVRDVEVEGGIPDPSHEPEREEEKVEPETGACPPPPPKGEGKHRHSGSYFSDPSHCA